MDIDDDDDFYAPDEPETTQAAPAQANTNAPAQHHDEDLEEGEEEDEGADMDEGDSVRLQRDENTMCCSNLEIRTLISSQNEKMARKRPLQHNPNTAT